MWTPNFDFANLYTQPQFDLDLFKSNCVCKHMPLKVVNLPKKINAFIIPRKTGCIL